jgi:VIT1/CCC1 family predicted Fe2+/Mn2+ transporter
MEEEKEHAHEQHEKEHEKHEEEHKDHAHAQLSSESRDLRDTRIATMVFTLAGAGIGVLSFFLNMDMVSIVIGFLALAGLIWAMKKNLNRKTKFFTGFIFIYLFIWLVAWVFLFNMA